MAQSRARVKVVGGSLELLGAGACCGVAPWRWGDTEEADGCRGRDAEDFGDEVGAGGHAREGNDLHVGRVGQAVVEALSRSQQEPAEKAARQKQHEALLRTHHVVVAELLEALERKLG